MTEFDVRGYVFQMRKEGRIGYPPHIAIVIHPLFHRFLNHPKLASGVAIQGIYSGNGLMVERSIGLGIWDNLRKKIQGGSDTEITAITDEEEKPQKIYHDPEVQQTLAKGTNVVYIHPSSTEDERVLTIHSKEDGKVSTQAPAPAIIVKGLLRENEDVDIFANTAYQPLPYTYYPEGGFPVNNGHMYYLHYSPEFPSEQKLYAVCSDETTELSELERYTSTSPKVAGANPARLIEMEVRIPSFWIGSKRIALENRLILSGLRAVSETLRLQTARAWERGTKQAELNKILNLRLSDLQARLFPYPQENPTDVVECLSKLGINCSGHKFSIPINAPNINTQITRNASQLLGFVYPSGTYFSFPYQSTFVLLPPARPKENVLISFNNSQSFKVPYRQCPVAYVRDYKNNTTELFDEPPILISENQRAKALSSSDGEVTVEKLLRTLITKYKIHLTGNPPMIVYFQREGNIYKADRYYQLERNTDIVDLINKLK